MKSTLINSAGRIVFSMAAILIIILVLPGTNFSQWRELPVSISGSNKKNTSITVDGSGGSILTWQDERSGKSEIYAQRINSYGNAMWTTNGIAICTLDSSFNPVIASDGSGGAIIVWESFRGISMTTDIYAQRVNSNGIKQWNLNGSPVAVDVFDQDTIAMTNDGFGGVILTWQDYRSNNGNADIYAQRLNSSGTSLWTTNGVIICDQSAEQRGPKLINDGNGGAFITWYDNRAGDYDIYTQRISKEGVALYTTNGVATCTKATDQIVPDICSDGAGGVIITWYDYRSTTDYNIYAQRQGPELAIMWTVDGVVMNNNVAYAQIKPKIVSDGLSGAIITWTDYRTNINTDIYAQHVSYSGALLWTATGVIISTAAGDQIKPRIAGDGNGGAFITWEDYRSGNADIYLQQITSAAAITLTDGGFAICTAINNQQNPMIISDGNSGVIVAWEDFRSGNNFDIYESGTNLTLPVELSSFTFIISAQNINLKWSTSSEQNNLGFDIERKTITENWSKIGFIKGQGTVHFPSNYSFEDKNLQTGKYYYRLKQKDNNGNFEYYSLTGYAEIGIPFRNNISQNYPNPFNPVTRINFEIPKDSRVNIAVFDLSGRLIKTIVNEFKTAGYYTIQFDASGISSGVYFYRFKIEGDNAFVMSKKFILLK